MEKGKMELKLIWEDKTKKNLRNLKKNSLGKPQHNLLLCEMSFFHPSILSNYKILYNKRTIDNENKENS